ncbi:hypothetical protein UJ101_01424 [Flavobacteriaceae bacterium UJ101]|nr:hypothetical protein UJ101_01424 [Flavobacteriaceae bacterium UJ101]
MLKNSIFKVEINLNEYIMTTLKNALLTTCCLLGFTILSAQLETPQPSPGVTLEQTVGLTDVKIEYSRPGMKDRKIFGELVPYDKKWRTGANAATKITFDEEVKLGGKSVKAGTYALYTIPGKSQWTVILSKDLSQFGAAGYKANDNVVQFTTKATKLHDTLESFTIDFSNFKDDSALVNIMWENTKVSFPIETQTHEKVEKAIKKELIDGPNARTYASAATYYLENDQNLDQALSWINTAIEKRPEAFWYVHQKARILAKQGKKKEAIASAEKSLKMAKAFKDGDFGYIARNENLIKEIKGK